MAEVTLIGTAKPLRPELLGAAWLLPLAPEPDEAWITAFSRYRWAGPLGLRLQPPVVICLDDATGVGLRQGHMDGSIAPYRQIEASIHAAVELANHIVAGKLPLPGERSITERHLRQLLRRAERPTPPASQP